MLSEPAVRMRRGDVSSQFASEMRHVGIAAWDIETDGLDFRAHQIRTCQVFVPGVGVEIVQVEEGVVPERLVHALASARVFKVFHHAPFDLRFMRHHWQARSQRVACTKVMSRIIRPDSATHNLAALARDYLGVRLDKGERLSDWSREELSVPQMSYAANDVIHLPALYLQMRKEATMQGVMDLIEQSFAYLPARVETELLGVGDVFAY